jgi:hypothetical protein
MSKAFGFSRVVAALPVIPAANAAHRLGPHMGGPFAVERVPGQFGRLKAEAITGGREASLALVSG